MRVLTIIAAAMMLAATPANAGDISKNEISKILSEQGYNVRDYDATKLYVDVASYRILVALDGADGDITYVTWLGLSGDKVSLSLLNRFNNEVKFGRAYVDRDGDVAIQMDRNVSGGVSAENIESDFDVFLLLISKFLSDLESQRIA